MRRIGTQLGALGLVAGLLGTGAGAARAQNSPRADRGSRVEDRSSRKDERGAKEPGIGSRSSVFDLQSAAARVPLDLVPAQERVRVQKVLEQPTLFAQGPIEVFTGSPTLYRWLLDHPDRGAKAWRRLGATCAEIADRGKGRFAWSDGCGSEVSWQAIHRAERLRVWLAEGNIRPAPLLPALPVHVVVVLHFDEAGDSAGHRLIRQQADVFFQTDSKTAAGVARLLGPSAPRIAEEGLAQMELFFSALVWYCEQHPERADSLFAERK